jgi:hypothetical protein
MFVSQQFGFSPVSPNPTVRLPSGAWAKDPSQAAIPQSKATTSVKDFVQRSPLEYLQLDPHYGDSHMSVHSRSDNITVSVAAPTLAVR